MGKGREGGAVRRLGMEVRYGRAGRLRNRWRGWVGAAWYNNIAC